MTEYVKDVPEKPEVLIGIVFYFHANSFACKNFWQCVWERQDKAATTKDLVSKPCFNVEAGSWPVSFSLWFF